MPDQAKPVTLPRRRLLRLSVRGLIVLVLVIGGSLGCHCAQPRVQRDAVAAIRHAGGEVYYNDDTHHWAPKWLLDWLGVDFFNHVQIVMISGDWSDAGMEHVGRLRALEEFNYQDISTPTTADCLGE